GNEDARRGSAAAEGAGRRLRRISDAAARRAPDAQGAGDRDAGDERSRKVQRHRLSGHRRGPRAAQPRVEQDGPPAAAASRGAGLGRDRARRGLCGPAARHPARAGHRPRARTRHGRGARRRGAGRPIGAVREERRGARPAGAPRGLAHGPLLARALGLGPVHPLDRHRPAPARRDARPRQHFCL
ncbi:MAG: hypothetical protein AVDCRST_MAG90-1856, partial [uncultured Microvirga sp.]